MVKDFEFTLWFGYQKNAKTDHTYCLLSRGFFRTLRADNTDSIITNWITNHPNAVVQPVSTFGPTMTNDPNSKRTYCWVIDKADTLNIHLVRRGALPGATMQRSKPWNELSREEKESNDYIPEDVHIHEEDYIVFIDKVIIAEEFARKNKLGIWSNEK